VLRTGSPWHEGLRIAVGVSRCLVLTPVLCFLLAGSRGGGWPARGFVLAAMRRWQSPATLVSCFCGSRGDHSSCCRRCSCSQQAPGTLADDQAAVVLDVGVSITDTRIALTRHIGPRGVTASVRDSRTRGPRRTNFTLSGPKAASGRPQGFSRTLKRASARACGSFSTSHPGDLLSAGCPADRAKPGMRGFFVIR